MKLFAVVLMPMLIGATGIALRMGVVGGLPPTCC